MKTSNKLLLGLFVFIVICLIIANFTVKRKIDTSIKSDVKIETTTQDSAAGFKNDSVAMDKAIGNE
jgi:hypothetical protein